MVSFGIIDICFDYLGFVFSGDVFLGIVPWGESPGSHHLRILWVVVSNIFLFSTLFGEDSHFD